MFGIVKNEPKPGITWRNVAAAPAPGHDEVTIAVHKAGICGTDYHIFAWDRWSAARVPTPMVIGHECVGHIVATGPGVAHLHQGQRVSVECHIACGHCVHCRTGNTHICGNVRIIGIDRPGCFTEAVTVPAANVWPVPDSIPDRHAAVFDPIGNAMHAATSVPIAGQDVLIIGAGPIGLFAVAIARAHGARRVIVQEPHPYRAGIAQRLGADLVIDPNDADGAGQVLAATGGAGPATILEMSGNARALNDALDMARNGADVALLGLFASPVTIDLSKSVIMKGITLHGVTGRRMFETWYQVEAFVANHPDAIDLVVTHILPASEYDQGFALMGKGDCGKVVLDFASLDRVAA